MRRAGFVGKPVKYLLARERERERTYRDASGVHAHRQPPGLRIKGHAGAGVWTV